jgi:hypothetical protein
MLEQGTDGVSPVLEAVMPISIRLQVYRHPNISAKPFLDGAPPSESSSRLVFMNKF